MCDVGAHCPACGDDLDQYETRCTEVNGRHDRHYECGCGATIHVTIPTPGLVTTRQDAEYQP